tara:strand:+ start:330 stop:509 length:180 start_codon:yes stop_codon:yes gene_type:complete
MLSRYFYIIALVIICSILVLSEADMQDGKETFHISQFTEEGWQKKHKDTFQVQYSTGDN